MATANPQIEQNVRSRKAAEQLFRTMIDCVRDDYRKLDQHGKRCFCEMAHAKFAGMLGAEQRLASEPPQQQQQKQPNREIEEAMELCEEVIAAAQDVPDEGSDFASSVEDSCREVVATIERTQRVTEKQWRALENWLEGLNGWIRR